MNSTNLSDKELKDQIEYEELSQEELEEYHNYWDFRDIVESIEKAIWQSRYDESMKMIEARIKIN